MKRIFLALSMVALLSGCGTFRNYEPLPTTDRVDLDRFMGKWYVISSTPSLLDRDPYNAVEIYERADRGIQITYQFNADSPSGDLKSISARAMVDNPGINTDWNVSYAWPWPFGSDYHIVYLEDDYSVAVIGHPDRKRVRILSRRPDISPPLYSDIILYLQQLGYDVGKIRRMPQ